MSDLTNTYAFRSAEAAYLAAPEDDSCDSCLDAGCNDCGNCESDNHHCGLEDASELADEEEDARDRARQDAIDDRIAWADEANRLIEHGPDDDEL